MEKIEIKEYLNQLIPFVEKHRIYFTSDAEAERYFKRCDRKGTRSEMSRFFLIYLFDNYVVFLYWPLTGNNYCIERTYLSIWEMANS